MRTIVRIANKFIEGGLMNFIHEIKSPKVIFHSNSLKKISEELDVISAKNILLAFDSNLKETADEVIKDLANRISLKYLKYYFL